MSGFCRDCGKDTTLGDEGLCLCRGCASKLEESAPSASHNSDYAAALRIFGEYRELTSQELTLDNYIRYCQQCLNSAKVVDG